MTGTRPRQGAFALSILQETLEQAAQGAELTLAVSTGEEERFFSFARGGVVFHGQGPAAGDALAHEILSRRLLPRDEVEGHQKRARAERVFLQDYLREQMIFEPHILSEMLEETIEDHLLGVMLWEGSSALYDLVPGGPPPRLQDPLLPVVRLEAGVPGLLSRVLSRREEAGRVLAALGGSLRSSVRLDPKAGVVKEFLLDQVKETPRPVDEVLTAVVLEGTPAFKAAQTIAEHVTNKKFQVERALERTPKEDLARAAKIEEAFPRFMSPLLARMHLERIYERADEKSKAADQGAGIADEHLRRDQTPEAIAALEGVIRLRPADIAARELLVKSLRGAKRPEASPQSLELARLLLESNLPGRARAAYELSLELSPGAVPVLWTLAGLLERLGDKQGAVKRYEELARLARDRNDREGEVAASQQVLLLDPSREQAKAVVERLSGNDEARRRHVIAIVVAVLLLVLAVGYGFYEISALRAYAQARDTAHGLLGQLKFDEARAAVNDFMKGWSVTRFRPAATALLTQIDVEEQLSLAQRSLEHERAAKELEAKDQLPRAAERWRAALKDAQEQGRKDALQAALARCEERVKKVKDDLAKATSLEATDPKGAYELVAQDVPHAPWLLEEKDVRVPLKLETVPTGARILVEGTPIDETPHVIERSFLPTHVRLEGRNKEVLELTLSGLESWSLLLTLPRPTAWRAKDVVASSAPLLLGDQVIVAGLDRSVTSLSREKGDVRWRASLGLFGECDAPLAALEQGTIVARARAGAVLGLSSTGLIRWTKELEPPPREPTERSPERPVATRAGVLVREGARGLALFSAEGVEVWRKVAPSRLVGAPVATSEMVMVAGERSVHGFKLGTGELAWTTPLDTNPVLGPVLGPGGVVFVPLEQGKIDRVEAGAVLSELKVEGAITSALGDERWLLVGTDQGAITAVGGGGKMTPFRQAPAEKRPVLWIAASSDLVLCGDQGMLTCLEPSGTEVWRHPVSEAPPAASDERNVYQGGPAGLNAFVR